MSHPAAFGPYQVVRLLGKGGMGRVYEVAHPGLPGRRLALKQLLSDEVNDDLLRRFLREAQLLARVDHPAVVRIHACEAASPQGPYMVMDLIEGATLEKHRLAGPLEPGQAANLVATLADALAAVHAAGVLHRDLKPENVVLRPDGSPVLLDFGIARGGEAERLTRTGALLGSPNFMAPEQAAGVSTLQLDERVDVYGLGGVLYALLTGRLPHQQISNLPALLHAVMNTPLEWSERPPGSTAPLPAALLAIGRRATALDPAVRYPSARALERDLRAWLDGEEPVGTRGRGTRLAGLVAAGLAVAGAVGAAWLLRGEPGVASAAPVASASGPARREPAPVVDPRPAARASWIALAHPGRPEDVAGGFFDQGRRLLSWVPEREGTLVEWRCDAPGLPAPTGRAWPLPARLEQLALAPAGVIVLACQGQLWRLDLRASAPQLVPLRLDAAPRGALTGLALSPAGQSLALATGRAEPDPARVTVFRLGPEDQARAWYTHETRDPAIGALALGEDRVLLGGHLASVATGANEVLLAGPAGLIAGSSTLNAVTAAALDPAGTPWFGNTGWGIHRFDPTGELDPGLEGVATDNQIDIGPREQLGQTLTRSPAHNGQVNQLRFAPAAGPARWLFSGSWHPPAVDVADRRRFGSTELRVWSPGPAGWTNVAGVGDLPRRLWSLDVDPAGERLLIGHGGQLELWDRAAIPALTPTTPRLPAWSEVTRALGRTE